MMACEALGMADLSAWHRLPGWQRRKWLAHTYAKVTGAYEAPAPGAHMPGSGATIDPAVLAQIAAQREG